jgi:hypothetical protein
MYQQGKLSKKLLVGVSIFLTVSIWALWLLGRDAYGERKVADPSAELGLSAEFTPGTPLYNLQQVIEKNLARKGQLARLNLPALEDKFTKDNLIISQDNSEKSLRRYAADMRVALSPFAVDRENEAELVIQGVRGEDPSFARKISASAVAHARAAARLSEIIVPSTATDIHLDLLNTVTRLSLLLGHMSNVTEEPVTGLQSAEIYLIEHPYLFIHINRLNRFFKDKGMLFSEEESIVVYFNLPTEND